MKLLILFLVLIFVIVPIIIALIAIFGLLGFFTSFSNKGYCYKEFQGGKGCVSNVFEKNCEEDGGLYFRTYEDCMKKMGE